MIERGIQEAVRQFRVAQAALAQQASDDRRHSERWRPDDRDVRRHTSGSPIAARS